jgi:outer membrane protein
MRSCLISSIALLCGLGAFAQAPSKVGVISIQGAIVGTKDGQKASQELDAKFVPKNKEFQNRQSEIVQLQDQLSKGGTVMADDKRNQLARDIDEKKKRLERDMQDAEEDLRGEQQKVLSSLGQRMMAVIEKYAKDNGYNLILDVSNQNTPVLYASSGIDITQDIVSLYDKTTANGAPAPTTSTTSTKPAPTTNVAPAKAPGTPR